MSSHRRSFVAGLGATVAATLAASTPTAWAQSASAQTADYPTRPIRIVVPYPAGGTTDILSRMMGVFMKDELGQPIIVENKPGAATALAAEHVVHSPPDGYTLMMVTVTTMAINPIIMQRLTYRPEQLIPVGLIAKAPFVLVAANSFAPSSVAELVASAKANPGKVNLATQGSGGSSHLVGEMFMAAAGIDMTRVHYKGSAPAIADTIAGHVQLHFDGIGTSLPHIAQKRLKALAVTSESRVPAAPQIPTFVEAGLPSVVSYSWYGIVAPAGTPQRVVDRLNGAINKALQSPEFKERLAQDAAEAGGGSPRDFAKLIATETDTWRKILAPLNIKVE